jgi:dihydrofolate reductase
MRKLNSFTFITLDGYYKGLDEDISWHRHGAEENEYAAEGAGSGSTLLFGRTTYEMMASYWPTPMALENDPAVAKGMNKAEKIVFSNTLKKPEWENTKVLSGDIVKEMKKMKQTPGKDMTILGSGSIVTQFSDAGLIDEYQVMVDPVAIGEGASIFKGLKNKLDLKLINTRVFKSGVVLLCYEPMKG